MSNRIAIAAALCLCLPGLLRAEPRKLLLVDFENETDAKAHTQAPIKTLSTEHATSGTHSLKILLPAGWVNIELSDPEMMKKLADYRTLAIDVFNPSNEQLHFYVQIQDALSAAGKESRYDHGYYFLPPGKSTLKFSLAASPRLWQHAGAICLDRKNLKSIRFFNGLDTGSFNPPLEFYIDNIRAEDSGVVLPAVEGLKAFQFGAARDTGDVEGFTAVTEKTPATSGTSGYCWQKPPGRFFSSSGNPDGLGNSVLGGAFEVDVKPGEYVVQTCIDPMGQWGWAAQYSSRTLRLNGKEVLSEKMDGPTFVKERYCRFEDDEDTPTTNLWNDRVKKISPVRSFEATVGEDGKLTVELSGDAAGGMCFLVVYPKDKAKEGAAWMAALDSIRKEDFDARINQGATPADGPAPEATADEKARGFIAFARSADKTLHCNSVPAQDERGAAMVLHACPGERTAAQLGLFPLAAAKGVTVTCGDLKGPGDAKIPAAAIDLKKVRHYYKRWGNGPCMLLLPLVLEKFQTLDLNPGFTRPVWVTVKVPDKLPAGEYKGALKIQSGDKSLEVPLSVTVHAFALDAADDVSISGMGTGAGFWKEPYPDAIELWWEAARQAMAMQGEHGFNAATGGPNMKLKAVKDGKAEIDFTDADRWVEIARQYGLTKLGDSYQGFDVNLGFGQDGSAGGPANNEANAKKAYGASYGELLKIAYAAVEQHAKEKNWPPRAFHLLDEPSGDAAVDAGKVFVEAHVKNAAGSKFSGYYAPGDKFSKREVFYPLLQLSVLSTVTEPVLEDIHKAGNQAWIYMNPGYPNFMNLRYLYGRWLYRAKLAGLDGATGGFYYPSTVPYYDMSDVEGSWGVLYPSKGGMNSTVWLEQIGLGINDYRYLKTLKAKIEAAKKAGGKDAAVQAAEQFLADTAKAVGLSSDPVASKSLSTPQDTVTLRQQAAKLIQDLAK